MMVLLYQSSKIRHQINPQNEQNVSTSYNKHGRSLIIFGYTIFINERNYDIHALVSYDVKAPKILALLSNPDEI